jgi:hypothetical protein
MFRAVLRYEALHRERDLAADLAACLEPCGFPDGLLAVHRLWGDCALLIRDARTGIRCSPDVPGLLLEFRRGVLRVPAGQVVTLVDLGAGGGIELLVKAWPDSVTPRGIGVEPWERFFTGPLPVTARSEGTEQSLDVEDSLNAGNTR